MIVIDAVNVARGLDIGGDEIEVRGLNIQRAQDTGMFVEGRDNVVAGNFIGTSVAGTVARPNGEYGVEVHGQDNVIGGSPPADRNVISSNGLAEVNVDNGSGHVVQGNRIGTGAGGGNGSATRPASSGVRRQRDPRQPHLGRAQRRQGVVRREHAAGQPESARSPPETPRSTTSSAST